MYELYGSIGSGNACVEAALAVSGANYRVITIRTGEKEHLAESFRVINPRQQVPALRLPDGTIMSESAAMMLHLADAFPDARLAPIPGSSARAQHDRWLIFMAVNLYEGELRKAYANRYTQAVDEAEGVRASADAYVKQHHVILEEAVSGQFLLGNDMSMADIYLWMLASWMDQDWLERHCPKVSSVARALRALPKIAPVHAVHFGEVQ